MSMQPVTSFADERGYPSDSLLNNITTGKTSFLVTSRNRYVMVRTSDIALFQVKYESSMMVCFDRQEFFVNHSLDQIQQMVDPSAFFRVNRQCLIGIHAIKDVEHYAARKLLVNPAVPVRGKVLVPKEKTSLFLSWLDNR